jgi:hypothetical protein
MQFNCQNNAEQPNQRFYWSKKAIAGLARTCNRIFELIRKLIMTHSNEAVWMTFALFTTN